MVTNYWHFREQEINRFQLVMLKVHSWLSIYLITNKSYGFIAEVKKAIIPKCFQNVKSSNECLEILKH